MEHEEKIVVIGKQENKLKKCIIDKKKRGRTIINLLCCFPTRALMLAYLGVPVKSILSLYGM